MTENPVHCFHFLQHVSDLFCFRDNSNITNNSQTNALRALLTKYQVKLKGLTHLAVSSACLQSEPVNFSLQIPATTLKNEKENIKQSVAKWARRGSEGALLVGAASYGGVLKNLMERPLSLVNTTSNMLVDPETIPMFASLFVIVLFMMLATVVWNKLDPAQFVGEPAVFRKFKKVIANMLGTNQVTFKSSRQGNMETLEITYTPKTLNGGMMRAWKQELTLSGGIQERRAFNYVLGRLKGGLDPDPDINNLPPRLRRLRHLLNLDNLNNFPPRLRRLLNLDNIIHRPRVGIDHARIMEARRRRAAQIAQQRQLRLNPGLDWIAQQRRLNEERERLNQERMAEDQRVRERRERLNQEQNQVVLQRREAQERAEAARQARQENQPRKRKRRQ